MELSIKSTLLFTAVILTGLSAGLFFAWSVSVIPGTKRIGDATYLATMQSINKAIINPAFALIFFGSLVLLAIITFQQFQTGTSTTFWLLLTATIVYAIGTLGVTGFGNVPLNNALEALDLNHLSLNQMKTFRDHYELKWNRLHTIRTLFAILSFMVALQAVFIHIKTN
ncbi:MAG: anthrone oxygenase family protein [Chitinophagales bacterium]